MAQDYLMRLIEQIGQMLASILTLRKAGRNEEAIEEINQSCWQTAGMSLDQIRRASPERVAKSLESSGPLRHTRAIMLAELLLQDADMSAKGSKGVQGGPRGPRVQGVTSQHTTFAFEADRCKRSNTCKARTRRGLKALVM